MSRETILYMGGFQLPDKNAAALRVLANAKALRELGHEVIFVHSLPDTSLPSMQMTSYSGFDCYEYKRENQFAYLTQCRRVISIIKERNVTAVIAYNYPAIALNRLRKYCQRNKIRCYADVTEWYVASGNPAFRVIKNFDTAFRMKHVHFKLDGIMAISEYLYRYYAPKQKAVKIPPLVDLRDEKWTSEDAPVPDCLSLIYAGSPSAQKERLDLLVKAVDKVAREIPITLKIVGLTREQYCRMYGYDELGEEVVFFGVVSNREVISMLKRSDWSVIIRDKNKVVQAGFPTKVSESISCGVPVIANRFSNVADYLDETNSILFDDMEALESSIRQAFQKKTAPDRTRFDYHRYLGEFDVLFSQRLERGERHG